MPDHPLYEPLGALASSKAPPGFLRTRDAPLRATATKYGTPVYGMPRYGPPRDGALGRDRYAERAGTKRK